MRRVETDRLPDLAADLVRLKVDIIVTAVTSRYSRCQKSNKHNSHRHGGCGSILLRMGLLTVWRGPAATSLGCRK